MALCAGRIKVLCPFAGRNEVTGEGFGELLSSRLVARGTQQLVRLVEMVHENLRHVCSSLTSRCLYPVCRGVMFLSSGCSGNLRIGHIAYERVPERVLLLSFKG